MRKRIIILLALAAFGLFLFGFLYGRHGRQPMRRLMANEPRANIQYFDDAIEREILIHDILQVGGDRLRDPQIWTTEELRSFRHCLIDQCE